ncbi:MAG: LysR family transcriptional regulator [Devosia nanyangense]|jgi:DNA-binding transcriptional LysR family regulator|uniref:LysR family transcriptional regulator n=1 Tax=Paradevosia shaoguanensis TaxID=1335043 RepID=A0AA41QNK2_9HYPH|nr:LysR family transcriptional regulator [Paradevosia shaoguanensis]MBI4048707.1 LysR family transcriptional regulator [Devosia nanyangense]MCF1743426.1 LysR family transcriptional regulator [Paradevosia shaoguanensis]MCI0127909.1 LysR family transcriptional regulator [Paradevosia shaoguanensis]
MTVPVPDLQPSWLRSFLEVARCESFSQAARELGLQQSTVSQHIRRLEAALGRRLLSRTTHSVSLTAEGAAALDLAMQVIGAHDSLGGHFIRLAQRRRMRFGISEDFALLALSDVLHSFGRQYPDVDLELTVGLSQALYDGFDSGQLDVIFAKRRQGDRRGVTAWRENLAWIGRPGLSLDPSAPVPLIAYPPPSVTRTLAVNALNEASRDWHLVCTSGSLSGIRAAALAGMGVAAHSPRLLPTGLAIIPETSGLPPLGQVEFAALGPGRGQTIANALIDTLMASIGRG